MRASGNYVPFLASAMVKYVVYLEMRLHALESIMRRFNLKQQILKQILSAPWFLYVFLLFLFVHEYDVNIYDISGV